MATSDRTTTTTNRPYSGKAPEERRTERRDRILDAGLDVFGTTGYATSTIDGLCKNASIGPKHFYEQFESREALLLAVYERILDHVAGAVLDALARAPSALEARITLAIDTLLHTFMDDPRVGRVACIEVVGAGAVLEQRRRDALTMFAQLISSEAAAAGVVRQTALTDSIALALVGGANELVVNWLVTAPRDRPTREHIGYSLAQLFMAATTIEAPPERRDN